MLTPVWVGFLHFQIIKKFAQDTVHKYNQMADVEEGDAADAPQVCT